MDLNAILAQLIAEADAGHAKYPQYKDHWKGWGLARARKNIRLKSGDIPAGTYMLLEQGVTSPTIGPRTSWEFVCVHNPVSGIDTHLPLKEVEVLVNPTAPRRRLSSHDRLVREFA